MYEIERRWVVAFSEKFSSKNRKYPENHKLFFQLQNNINFICRVVKFLILLCNFFHASLDVSWKQSLQSCESLILNCLKLDYCSTIQILKLFWRPTYHFRLMDSKYIFVDTIGANRLLYLLRKRHHRNDIFSALWNFFETASKDDMFQMCQLHAAWGKFEKISSVSNSFYFAQQLVFVVEVIVQTLPD